MTGELWPVAGCRAGGATSTKAVVAGAKAAAATDDAGHTGIDAGAVE